MKQIGQKSLDYFSVLRTKLFYATLGVWADIFVHPNCGGSFKKITTSNSNVNGICFRDNVWIHIMDVAYMQTQHGGVDACNN